MFCYVLHVVVVAGVVVLNDRIGTKKFFRLQELSFEAETRLKKVKRHVERSEMPSMETFIMLAEALSFLKPIAAIQPAWEQ